MRFAKTLLVSLMAVALVACDGGDDEAAAPVTETAAPVPLAQRFLTAADAPGTKPDPVEKRQTTADFDEFIATMSEGVIDTEGEDSEGNDMTTVFQEAGFKWAGVDARFYGEKHSFDAPHLFGSVIELQSEEGARSALDWLEADSMRPCPMSCAVQISNFDIDDIPEARGVHRIATAKDIEAAGTEDQQPSDSYWVGFTEGSIVYMVDLSGPPGSASVSEEQVQKIASAYYDRLASN